jgi:hypothetical protein
MPRFLLLPTAVLTGTLILGCGEPSAPSESANTAQPSLRTDQNAETSRARVFRFNDLFFWVIVDFERGLTTVLGATPEEHIAACQSGLIPEEASIQDVLRPDGSVKTLVKGGEMGVTVWPAASFDICGELMAVPFLAGGSARVMYVDNDVFSSQKRANAFGVRANGSVTIFATGEELHFLARYQATALRSGEVKHESSEILLR